MRGIYFISNKTKEMRKLITNYKVIEKLEDLNRIKQIEEEKAASLSNSPMPFMINNTFGEEMSQLMKKTLYKPPVYKAMRYMKAGPTKKQSPAKVTGRLMGRNSSPLKTKNCIQKDMVGDRSSCSPPDKPRPRKGSMTGNCINKPTTPSSLTNLLKLKRCPIQTMKHN